MNKAPVHAWRPSFLFAFPRLRINFTVRLVAANLSLNPAVKHYPDWLFWECSMRALCVETVCEFWTLFSSIVVYLRIIPGTNLFLKWTFFAEYWMETLFLICIMHFYKYFIYSFPVWSYLFEWMDSMDFDTKIGSIDNRQLLEII